MLLSYNRLVKLVEQGVITNTPLERINACSIDLTLGRYIYYEESSYLESDVINLRKKEVLHLGDYDLEKGTYNLEPGEFILAQTQQTFNLPDNIAAEYKLKSSLARCGLNHALAGWCDPGWHGSVLTLELKNITSKHFLQLEKGMKIGQIIFYEVEPVPKHASYRERGQYNNDKTATSSKGLR